MQTTKISVWRGILCTAGENTSQALRTVPCRPSASLHYQSGCHCLCIPDQCEPIPLPTSTMGFSLARLSGKKNLCDYVTMGPTPSLLWCPSWHCSALTLFKSILSVVFPSKKFELSKSRLHLSFLFCILQIQNSISCLVICIQYT